MALYGSDGFYARRMFETAPSNFARIAYADGSSLAVEVEDGLVQLVTRDASGTVVEGCVLAPSEAHRLGDGLVTAAFAAREAQ